MTMENGDVLAGRIDGLARVVMALIADLEMREQLDGQRFCGALQRIAEGKRQADGQQIAAATIADMARQLDEAREARRKLAGRA